MSTSRSRSSCRNRSTSTSRNNSSAGGARGGVIIVAAEVVIRLGVGRRGVVIGVVVRVGIVGIKVEKRVLGGGGGLHCEAFAVLDLFTICLCKVLRSLPVVLATSP